MSIKTDQAVLLSVAADIEMYTTELVIKEISTPFNKNDMSSTSCAVPISALPDQMLEKHWIVPLMKKITKQPQPFAMR